MTFMRCATSDADRRVNGVEQRRKGDATNDRFLLLATMEWRIRANRRTDADGRAAFQCNIMVLTPGSLGRQIALFVLVRVWDVP